MREITEIQYELKELADDARQIRARLIRLVDELDRGHMSKEEAMRRLAEGRAPNVQGYLVVTLDLLEVEDLNKTEKILRQASGLNDQGLAKIWSERDQESGLDQEVDSERPS